MVSDALVSLHIFFDPVLADLIPTVVSVVVREGPGEWGAQWTEFVSWEPRAFVYHKFLVITNASHLAPLQHLKSLLLAWFIRSCTCPRMHIVMPM